MREPFVATVPARYARELLAAVKAAVATIDADIAGNGTVAPFMVDDNAPRDRLVHVIVVDVATQSDVLKRTA